ncbi:D-2-hydroxyacid dehydrogenase [Paenibacillus eucommiae]|uniref:Phosphoglycerate dehydrogenase-like enzyme n=1 Tax=Paenibacillus eucommiae TaxID=1355755 RepID=A0ABS4IRG5_9BACL|nr:D-2-hydroxyacid dehydrogenase [Paenibacillus eucommiae]MBP1990118.1 phosphoglycerate dehydrogenase-like enzyme [Paenibacillus eucommiae]
MINVLINMPAQPERMEKLKSIQGINVTWVPFREDPDSLPKDMMRDQHILFCSTPPDNFHDLESLQWVQISSVGYNQLLGIGMLEQGVRASNAQGVFDVPISEWNVSMMIQLARNMKGMYRNQENKVWDRSARFQTEIRGTRVGIWGYGGIGRETTRLLKALGVHVQVFVREGIKERNHIYRVPGTGDPLGVLPDSVFTTGQEKEFLRNLDYLIIAVPLTKHTEGMIGKEELQALPATAFVLNPARGPIINEQALLQALSGQWIAGAALDTHYYYPMPEDHPLWEFPNVIMTPHISGSSESTHFLERIWGIFGENIQRFMNDEPLLNELSERQLQGD